MNLYDRAMSHTGRMAAPLAAYPGLRLTGRSSREALSNANIQLECLNALEKRLQPDIVFPLLDLTVEAEGLGLALDFFERRPPKLADQQLPSLERFYELGVPDPERTARMPVFLDVAEGLADDEGRMAAAFTTGPFTLLGQLMGADTLLEQVRGGAVLNEAMAFTTSVVGEYAAALASRVDVIWVVDPAAEGMSSIEFRSVYRPYITGLAGIIRGIGAACVLHICGDVSHLLEEMSLTGFDGLSLDSEIDLATEVGRLPKNLVLIGNIDVERTIQRGSTDDVHWEVRRLLRHMDKARNFILSTGCDVVADAPIRNLEAMMEEARTWKSRSALL